MPPPLIRDGAILITADGKLGAICLACEGAVRIIWSNRPNHVDLQAAISISAGYFLWEAHYDGQWWWGIDFQAIYEDGLFNESGEYTFTVTVSGVDPTQSSDLGISFTNGEDGDSESVSPAASKTVTVRLDGTITLS